MRRSDAGAVVFRAAYRRLAWALRPREMGHYYDFKLVSAAQVRAKHCAEGSVAPREATFNTSQVHKQGI